MNSFLVICCIIAASLFVGSTRAALCDTLTPKTIGDTQTETALVNLWVNASIAAYASSTNPPFDFFKTINDSSRSAHVSFYGR
jgi:hypothetical protein